MPWVRRASGLHGIGVSKEIKENGKDLTALLLRLILSSINEKLPFTSP
jgi:hypothetical protein